MLVTILIRRSGIGEFEMNDRAAMGLVGVVAGVVSVDERGGYFLVFWGNWSILIHDLAQ